jgi:hypothetical protein
MAELVAATLARMESEKLKKEQEKQEAKAQAERLEFNPAELEAESEKTLSVRQAKKTILPDIAAEHDLDHETLSNAVQDELKAVLPAHQRQEEARQYISKMGWNKARIDRAEDSYKDYSHMKGVDASASEWAGLFPDVAGPDEHYWVEKMWDLSKQGKQDPPSATDEDFVRSVAKKLVDQGYAQGAPFFPDENSEETGDTEVFSEHPSYTAAGEPVPFSRMNNRSGVRIIVDRYVRQLLQNQTESDRSVFANHVT